MGKRSDFPRKRHDSYDTIDPRAVRVLLPHLPARSSFIEPCGGSGKLREQLEAAGHVCPLAIDIAPRGIGVRVGDAGTFRLETATADADLFVTNPPWTFELVAPIIFNLFWQRPTWLLLGADFMHNGESAPYMALCRKVVTIGRLRWEPGTRHKSVDNCCWYLFAAGGRPEFHGSRG